MVAPQYLQRRAPKGEPFSIIVINKSKIVSAEYAFCTFKLMNWQKMSEKQETKNLRPIWNWRETIIIRVLTVQRIVGDGVTSEHELNSKFSAIMILTVDSFFWIAGNFEKVFKIKVCTRQARNRWNRYSCEASGEISLLPGLFKIGKLGCTVAFKNIISLIVF